MVESEIDGDNETIKMEVSRDLERENEATGDRHDLPEH